MTTPIESSTLVKIYFPYRIGNRYRTTNGKPYYWGFGDPKKLKTIMGDIPDTFGVIGKFARLGTLLHSRNLQIDGIRVEKTDTLVIRLEDNFNLQNIEELRELIRSVFQMEVELN